MNKNLKEILEICKKDTKDCTLQDIKNICEKQLLADELNKKFGTRLSGIDINNEDCIYIDRIGTDMYIAKYGKNYNRNILNISTQPENEQLFSIEFPTGPYIFGEAYDFELFNRFFEELKTYQPKYVDEINHSLYFDLKTGAKAYKNYNKILEKYNKEYDKKAKQRKIDKLQEQIKYLQEED